MSVLKRISSFIVQKLLPIKYKVWLLETLACDIAAQGEDGDTELAHINSYEAKLLKSIGGSGTINSKTGLKMYGSGGGSAPAPAATSTVVEKAEFPPELRPYITDILSKAQAQEESRLAAGYPLYPGPRIAPFTTEELASREGIKSLVGSSQPGFDVAKGLTAAGTGAATASDIASGMSPYMQNVVDIEKREAQRAAEPMQQKIAAEAIGAQGSFGGSRQAILEAEANRNLQQQLGDIQTRGQQAAFTEAQRAFESQKQRQLAGGQQYASIVPQQQGLAFKELGALAGIGEQDRQQTQKALDLGFQEFREQQQYPEASLQQYQSIIRGFPLNPTTTQTQQSILPTPSLGQQLIGAGTGALGLAGAAKTLFKDGGTLKEVPEDNEGLSKLPAEVRNRMGFMKDGGSPKKKISKKENTMYKKMLMDLINKTSASSTKGLNSIVKKAPGGTLDLLNNINFKTIGGEKALRTLGDSFIKGAGIPYEEEAKSVKDRIRELQGLTVRNQDEIDKELEEDERMDKFKAFMQLAQFGAKTLEADPSRGTLGAIGSAFSETGPGFTEIAEQKRKREKDERTRQLAEKATVLDLDIKSLGLTKDVKGEKDKAIDRTTDIMKTIYSAENTTKDALIKANKDTKIKRKDLISILNASGDDLTRSADTRFGFGYNKEGTRVSLDENLDPAEEERNIKSKQYATLANAILKKNFLEIEDGILEDKDMKTQQQAELEAEAMLSAAYNQKKYGTNIPYGKPNFNPEAELYKFRTLGEIGEGEKAKAYKTNVMNNQDFEAVLRSYGLYF